MKCSTSQRKPFTKHQLKSQIQLGWNDWIGEGDMKDEVETILTL